eukprot:3396168-Amphidinium_carterae.2
MAAATLFCRGMLGCEAWTLTSRDGPRSFGSCTVITKPRAAQQHCARIWLVTAGLAACGT